MNYILRAWLSVTRKKIKSLLLLFIVFVLCNVIAGMVSIGQSANNVTKIIKKDLGVKASIQVDSEVISGLTSEEKSAIPLLDETFINAIGKLTQIQYYDYNYVRFFQTELYQMNTNCKIYCNSDYFFLYGSHLASIYDILQHKIKLVSGRVFTDEEINEGKQVGLLSSKISLINKIVIGSIIKVYPEYDYDPQVGKPILSPDEAIEITIIGTYEPYPGQEDTMKMVGGELALLLSNDKYLYVPNELVKRENERASFIKLRSDLKSTFKQRDPIYVLNSVDDLPSFVAEVTPQLPKYYRLVTSTMEYDTIAGPIENLEMIAGILVYSTIILSISIIGLVVRLFLKNRRRELGIYLSLGEPKRRILGQILIEVLIVGILGITLSLPTGFLLAKNISSDIFAQLLQKTNFSSISVDPENSTQLTKEKVESLFVITLDSDYIISMYALGIGTLLISSLLPLLYVYRLNPKKILM